MGASSPTRRRRPRSPTRTCAATCRATVLKVTNLNVSIAAVHILRDVSLELAPGSMTGLIGRNGAGKTTLMKTVMGLLKPASGSIAFDGREMRRVATHERALLGIGYMPEDR